MRNLVEDTLTLAWLENEKPSLSEETLDLIDLLDSILDDARYEYPDHTIDAELPDGAELAGSSHRALAQAIENVIRNACNYTPAGGTVRISLRASERGYRLEVADQGPGVPLEQLDLIFKPFFRSAKARDHWPTGYGLGLALARRQVEATGGWIRAENLSSGGLLMRIWLPMNASEN